MTVLLREDFTGSAGAFTRAPDGVSWGGFSWQASAGTGLVLDGAGKGISVSGSPTTEGSSFGATSFASANAGVIAFRILFNWVCGSAWNTGGSAVSINFQKILSGSANVSQMSLFHAGAAANMNIGNGSTSSSASVTNPVAGTSYPGSITVDAVNTTLVWMGQTLSVATALNTANLYYFDLETNYGAGFDYVEVDDLITPPNPPLWTDYQNTFEVI